VLRGFGYNITVGDAPLTDQATMAAISQFQKGYKLPVNGMADSQTQDLAANLVKILQANLNLVVKPSPGLPRTQFYGPLTEAAVKKFQQQFNLPVTGIATLQIRQKIDQEAEKILNNQSPTPSAPRTRTTPTPTPSPQQSPMMMPTPTPSPRQSPMIMPTSNPNSQRFVPQLTPMPTSPNQIRNPSLSR
jgi:peptidoglycan hydrolase-like protein with peptidoglycan-binding domain